MAENQWRQIAACIIPSRAMSGRHDPSIADERPPAEDEHGAGSRLGRQSRLPRDLALVRVLAPDHAGVAHWRASANLGIIFKGAKFNA